MYIKSTIDIENQAPILIFIYTISKIVLPCIVLLLNTSQKLIFHVHDFLKGRFVYIIPFQIVTSDFVFTPS